MRILAFSDLHCDLEQAARLTEFSADADVVIGASGFAPRPPGTGRDDRRPLRDHHADRTGARKQRDRDRPARGCGRLGRRDGASWRIDRDRRTGLLRARWRHPHDPLVLELRPRRGRSGHETRRELPEDAFLVVHSPPKGHCDSGEGGPHFGSKAILEAIEAKQPEVAVCGHIHEAWGQVSEVGRTRVMNLGPTGTSIEI